MYNTGGRLPQDPSLEQRVDGDADGGDGAGVVDGVEGAVGLADGGLGLEVDLVVVEESAEGGVRVVQLGGEFLDIGDGLGEFLGDGVVVEEFAEGALAAAQLGDDFVEAVDEGVGVGGGLVDGVGGPEEVLVGGVLGEELADGALAVGEVGGDGLDVLEGFVDAGGVLLDELGELGDGVVALAVGPAEGVGEAAEGGVDLAGDVADLLEDLVDVDGGLGLDGGAGGERGGGGLAHGEADEVVAEQAGHLHRGDGVRGDLVLAVDGELGDGLVVLHHRGHKEHREFFGKHLPILLLTLGAPSALGGDSGCRIREIS